MSDEIKAPEAPESPWWQTGLFLAVATVMLIKAPYLAASIAFLGLLIFIHELGHFMVARWQGMRVEMFSLGFGPALVKVTRGGTTYQVAAIPLGGFVKPAGEEPKTDEDVANAKPDEFMGRPWWSRLLVLLAGPTMNLLFPILALFLVYSLVGRQDPWGPPMVTAVFPDTGAIEAGMKPGDLVIRINGLQVSSTTALAGLVDKESRRSLDLPLAVDLLRGGKPLSLAVKTRLNKDAAKYLMGVQVQPSPPPFSTTVRSAGVLTPAEKAGLRKGDVVLSVDGQAVRDGFTFGRQFADAKSDPVPIVVSRGAEALTLMAARKQPVPDAFDPELVGLLGLEFEPVAGVSAVRRERLSPVAAFNAALGDSFATAATIVLGLREFVRGKLSARDSLGGPVAILRMASQEAERGWEYLLGLMLQISLTLGLMNLLPIPLLDGGTILYCVIEGMRGKPLRLKTQTILQNIGITLIGTVFVFTLVNDLLRWTGH
jgi:regulator of sigma E protease